MEYELHDSFQRRIKGEPRKFDLGDDFEPGATSSLSEYSRFWQDPFKRIERSQIANSPRARVFVTTRLRQREIAMREKPRSVSMWEKTEEIYSAVPFLIEGVAIIELTNDKNGKVTYITPPDFDAKGVKMTFKKKYRVELKRNWLTGNLRYDFSPVLPLELSKEEIKDVLTRVAKAV
jgi:hypothetical protein